MDYILLQLLEAEIMSENVFSPASHCWQFGAGIKCLFGNVFFLQSVSTSFDQAWECLSCQIISFRVSADLAARLQFEGVAHTHTASAALES